RSARRNGVSCAGTKRSITGKSADIKRKSAAARRKSAGLIGMKSAVRASTGGVTDPTQPGGKDKKRAAFLGGMQPFLSILLVLHDHQLVCDKRTRSYDQTPLNGTHAGGTGKPAVVAAGETHRRTTYIHVDRFGKCHCLQPDCC